MAANRGKVWARVAAAAAVTVLSVGPSSAADVAADALKAAFLYNFALFVEWPSPPTTSFDLCLYRPEPFNAAENLAGKLVGRAPVRVLRPTQAGELRACHLLYLGAADAAEMKRVRMALAEAPVLTVADASGEVTDAAMITILRDENRLTFAVSPGMAAGAGLKISAKLLRLARQVH